MKIRLAVIALLLLAAPAAAEVDWITDPDEALAAAREAGKPVLAVAMDHA